MHHLNDNIHDCYIQITIRSLFCYPVHEMRPNIVKRLSPGCGLQILPDDTLHSPHAFCNKTDIIHCHSSIPIEVCFKDQKPTWGYLSVASAPLSDSHLPWPVASFVLSTVPPPCPAAQSSQVFSFWKYNCEGSMNCFHQAQMPSNQ